MFEKPRRGRQARNFATNAPKILDLKSSFEQIFSENWRWCPWLLGQLGKSFVIGRGLRCYIDVPLYNHSLVTKRNTDRGKATENLELMIVTNALGERKCPNELGEELQQLTSRWQITPFVLVNRRQVAETRFGDRSLRLYWLIGDKLQKRVSVTDHSVCTGQ